MSKHIRSRSYLRTRIKTPIPGVDLVNYTNLKDLPPSQLGQVVFYLVLFLLLFAVIVWHVSGTVHH